MRRHHSKRRSFSFSWVIRESGRHFTGLRAQPFRAGLLGFLMCSAIWAILTRSLPYALAPTQPDLALTLNSANPVALISKAESLRKKLAALIPQVEHGHTAGEEKAGARDDDLIRTREVLRGEIRDLALRAISSDPLNARAFRLLAEMSDRVDQIRMLLADAFKRSRHESVAAFWLLSDSFYKHDYKATLYYADSLLRTRPQLETLVFDYLFAIAEDVNGRELLAIQLGAYPPWRTRFLEAIPPKAKEAETPFALISALQGLGKPVTQKEIEPYLNFLISVDKVELAYNAWLQFLPKTDLDDIGLLTNASLERKPSGLPFDWQFAKGDNAIAEIIPSEEHYTGHVLHITFGDGRIQFPEVSQTILLKPGRYHLEGKLRGAIDGKRGLRWRFQCLSGSRRLLSETEMLLGQFQQWRIFKLEAVVPDLKECRGQVLQLFHNSRSASERFLSGEVWFRDLRLEHVID